MSVLIKNAVSVDDYKKAYELEKVLFNKSEALSKRSMARFTQNRSLYLLFENDAVIGSIILQNRINAHHARIYSLGIHPHFQGKGYGRLLLDFAKQTLKDVFQKQALQLEVNVANTQAIQLYRNNRFEIISELPHYYSNGDDAYRMRWVVTI